MDVTKPYEFIGFGAMDVTKPYKFIGFGRNFTKDRVPDLLSFRIGNNNYNFSFGLWPVSDRTWSRDPFKRVGLEKLCRTHPKLAPGTNSEAENPVQPDVGGTLVWVGLAFAECYRQHPGSNIGYKSPTLCYTMLLPGQRWASGPDLGRLRMGTTSE